MAAIERDEFRDYMQLLRDELREDNRALRTEVQGVNDRLDRLNGRTRASETAIVVLRKDVDEAQATRDERRRTWDGWIGGAVAATLTVIVEWLVRR